VFARSTDGRSGGGSGVPEKLVVGVWLLVRVTDGVIEGLGDTDADCVWLAVAPGALT
jgi:hypothetical protein